MIVSSFFSSFKLSLSFLNVCSVDSCVHYDCTAGALQDLTDVNLSGNNITGVLQLSWAGLPCISSKRKPRGESDAFL